MSKERGQSPRARGQPDRVADNKGDRGTSNGVPAKEPSASDPDVTPAWEADASEIKRMVDESGWGPAMDPSKDPVVVHDRDTFVREVLYGDHMNTAVVFRNGIKKLGWQDHIPASVRKSLFTETQVMAFLEQQDPDFM